jgi:hypothetical protein
VGGRNNGRARGYNNIIDDVGPAQFLKVSAVEVEAGTVSEEL